ncbi:MAG: hypothetical protein MJZ61_08105 [Bacteroidales bacterium]|nr:hypothetical protein [Bacteroidales bacterium]
MRQFIRYCFDEKPLLFCIWAGFFFRIIAVLFAQGISFGFDHHVYIENAQQIVSGNITVQQLCTDPSHSYFISHGHSIIYLYFNTIVLYICEFLNIFDSRAKTFVLKLILGLISVVGIYYAYRITYRLATRRAALAVGILTSMLWFIPYISVQNLPENIAALIILAAIYRLVKTRRRTYKMADDIFTGFLMGISVSLCYNIIILLVGVWILFVIISKAKRGSLIIFGAIIAICITEGLINTLLFNSPFYLLGEYIGEIASGGNATSGFKSIYMYVSILSMVIPLPWGLFAMFGFAQSWKRCFLLFMPTAFYILGLYLLPNKEEKFILVILPIFLILSVSGWYIFKSSSHFWTSHPKLNKISAYLFFAINIPALVLTSTAYTRKPQVESMLYLSRYKAEISSILVDDEAHTSSKSLPTFYLGKDITIYWLHHQDSEPDQSIYYSCVANSPHTNELYTEIYFTNPRLKSVPEFVLFYGDYDLNARLSKIRNMFPNITFERTFSPSLADKVIQWVNPSNSNMNLHVYRVN